MKNVWEVCKFADEIETGQMDLNKFAVELYTFLRGEASPMYQDPKRFLEGTYLTDTMAEILGDTILRLNGKTAEPVHSLETGFGAGKTHTLILLHHVLNNPELGMQYVADMKLEKKIGTIQIPDTKVVAIDCRQLKRNTLWGEIADKMGEYEKFENYDKTLAPPPDIDIITDLFHQPTLLMVDEILHLLLESESRKIGNTTMAAMTISFFMNLISAISSSKNSKFLYTISENMQIYKDQLNKIRTLDQDRVESLLSQLHSVQSRQARSVAPVGPSEILDVVRQRLVVEINKPERDHTINQYLEYYESKGVEISHNYRKQMVSAYPFHPILLKEILYERVSTIPDFNRTRGILRLMSLVSHNIIKNKPACQIIGPSFVDLEDESILNELTARLGFASTYQPIIESDCIIKAKTLDPPNSLPLITMMARIIYLYSLIGAKTKSGIRLNQMKLAIGSPDIDLGLVEDGLEKISNEFWYINDNNGYHFDKEPNLNKIIADIETEIRPTDIHNYIERVLKRIFEKIPGKINTIIWNSEIPECDILTLIVMEPSLTCDEESIKRHVTRILQFLPGEITVRTRKNTLVFLYPDYDIFQDVEKSARHFLAIDKAKHHDSVSLYDKELHKKMLSKKSAAEGDLEAECRRAYNLLAYPAADPQNNPSIQLTPIIPNQSHPTMVHVVLQHLQDNGKLIVELSKDGIILTDPTSSAQILDEFKNDRNSKMLENQISVLDAAKNAVSDNIFYPAHELRKHNGKYIVDPHINIDWGTYLIPPELADIPSVCSSCKNEMIYSKSLNCYICTQCSKTSQNYCSQCNRELTAPLQLDGLYYCSNCIPYKHKHKIICNSLSNLFDVIEIIRVLKVGLDFKYVITANLSVDYADIVVNSTSTNLTEIESLFKIMADHEFNGSSTILITSQTNLSKKLDGRGLVYENLDA